MPSITAPKHVGSSVSVSLGLTTEIESITGSLSFGDGVERTSGYPGGFGGIYNELTSFVAR